MSDKGTILSTGLWLFTYRDDATGGKIVSIIVASPQTEHPDYDAVTALAIATEEISHRLFICGLSTSLVFIEGQRIKSWDSDGNMTFVEAK